MGTCFVRLLLKMQEGYTDKETCKFSEQGKTKLADAEVKNRSLRDATRILVSK